MKRTINEARIGDFVLAAAIALALAVFGTGSFASEAHADAGALTVNASSAGKTITALENGVYEIKYGSKCLEIKGASTSDSAKVRARAALGIPSQRWRIQSVGSGMYRLISVASNKALGVSGGMAKNGSAVVQGKYKGTQAQKWILKEDGSNGVMIVSAANTGLALGVDVSASKVPRARVYTAGGAKTLGWTLRAIKPALADGYYTFTNVRSKKALDVEGASYDDGANVQQYTKNGTLAQMYRIVYEAKTGYYTIRCCASGKALDVEGASSANGANVQQYTANRTNAQKWSIEKISGKTMTIRSAVSGKVLTVQGASKANSANVRLQTAKKAKHQRWKVSKKTNWIPEGVYFMASAKNSAKMLDIEGASQESGANANLYKSNETNAQRFMLRRLGGGAYAIQNVYSGLYIGPSGTAAGSNVSQSTVRTPWIPVLINDGISFRLKGDTGIVLETKGGKTANGTNVQVGVNKGKKSQKWLLDSTAILVDGVYEIKSARGGYALTAPSTKSGVVKLGDASGATSQMFELKNRGDDAYRVTCLANDRVLKASVSGTANSGSVAFASRSDAATKKWRIGLTADGALTLTTLGGGAKGALTVSGTNPAAGSIVRLEAGTAKETQKWKVSVTSLSASETLSISLNEIVDWNWAGNSYNKKYLGSWAALYNAMDPKQCNDYAFVDLRKPTKTTAKQLNSFIATYGSKGKLAKMGAAFVGAAKKYGLNQDYLLAHAILESGWGTSELASGYYYAGGTIDGSYYPAGTYYNFYGIGAYDSSPLSGGRKLAIINGWNTRKKAIYGAAKWIATNYTYRSYTPQYTLYGMKWDYLASNATNAYGWHQYATGASWANSIASLMEDIYARTGTGSSLSYIVPSYR